jgi:hypothetical protein
MNSRCPNCGAALAAGKAYCPSCGWRMDLPVDAIVLDPDSPAALEQGRDTLWLGVGLLALGVLVFAGGMLALLQQFEGDVLEFDFDSFITVLAIITGLTLALFIASAVVFAVRRGGSDAARVGGVTVSVVGSIVVSTVATVLTTVIVVVIVIIAAITAAFAALANACNCQPNASATQTNTPPAAITFDDGGE